ncbi:uncharacterized protein PGTG_21630 [Puccinia graminis f. sp. tritici CRL 75-36-700-3]|uniref:Uncharacterized protein n=1 Tax=Puccinia graminis f. sp. tritici (strain CRL 75-36-700-3 / race SCCL) TaxID=418459 RepID=H6QRN3_PUCGT|nr:uncharacterized protein PGTG_21630 [Puccinia graminis f. sp. tritici CRL 75-36-700-3]EHS63327.1 hypothetical protein PGTG_21630 [Puccinia graminis f. sp. tritici CRL 75-36-700-3]
MKVASSGLGTIPVGVGQDEIAGFPAYAARNWIKARVGEDDGKGQKKYNHRHPPAGT